MDMTDVLSRLRTEIGQILDLYEETENIYREALRAMGQMSEPMPESKSSAEVTVSLPPSQSLSTDKWGL
jgi:hypothetical protein